MRRLRLLLLMTLLVVSSFMLTSKPASVADPPNACQICIDECRAAFPKDPAKQRRCMLSCECNPPAPGF